MPGVIDHFLGPKREAKQLPNGDWEVTVTPPSWSGYSATLIKLSPQQYQRYLRWFNGELLIQEAFPEFDAEQREVLLSGIDSEEWSTKIGGSNND